MSIDEAKIATPYLATKKKETKENYYIRTSGVAVQKPRLAINKNIELESKALSTSEPKTSGRGFNHGEAVSRPHPQILESLGSRLR